MRKWKIVQLVITVKKMVQDSSGVKDWKKPFKRLKLSAVRAEEDNRILLDVAPAELLKVQKMLDGRFQVENVIEPEEEPNEIDQATEDELELPEQGAA